MANNATKKLSRLGEWLRSNEPPLIDTSFMEPADRERFYQLAGVW